MVGSYDPKNIFTKIIAGELPSHKVFEDDTCIAIMDIMPESKGHMLVIPKEGSRNLLDADPQVLAQIIQRVQTLAKAAKSALHADGILLRQSSEEVAGQTVYHLHFHIIPCYVGQKRGAHSSNTASNEELAAVADKIKAAIK